MDLSDKEKLEAQIDSLAFTVRCLQLQLEREQMYVSLLQKVINSPPPTSGFWKSTDEWVKEINDASFAQQMLWDKQGPEVLERRMKILKEAQQIRSKPQ